MRKERMGNSFERNLNNRVLVTGAGGFFGGTLCHYLKDKGFMKIRGVDKKPTSNWVQRVPGVE